MKTKTCSKCNTIKPVCQFTKASKSPDGLMYYCKPCQVEYRNQWRRLHGVKPRANIRTSSMQRCVCCKRWKVFSKFGADRTRVHGRNTTCKKCANESAKRYAISHRSRLNDYQRIAYRKNVQRKLGRILRNRVYQALRGYHKSASSIELLGCSIDTFRVYLERRWAPGMSWDNYAVNGWHIDHIIPCSAFDLTDPSEQRACFHYTNQQPLWAKDNLAKGSRLQ